MRIEELSEEHESAFLEMVSEFQKSDPETYEWFFSQEKPQKPAPKKTQQKAWSSSEYKAFLKEQKALKADWRPAANKVSVTRYVLTTPDGQLLALGLMRFPLDEITELDGGNLVCAVPLALRKKGYGSYCLALMLFEAVRAGLRRVLVTAPTADQAARKMIEKNRGVLLDVISSPDPRHEGRETARYWISFG